MYISDWNSRTLRIPPFHPALHIYKGNNNSRNKMITIIRHEVSYLRVRLPFLVILCFCAGFSAKLSYMKLSCFSPHKADEATEVPRWKAALPCYIKCGRYPRLHNYLSLHNGQRVGWRDKCPAANRPLRRSLWAAAELSSGYVDKGGQSIMHIGYSVSME